MILQAVVSLAAQLVPNDSIIHMRRMHVDGCHVAFACTSNGVYAQMATVDIVVAPHQRRARPHAPTANNATMSSAQLRWCHQYRLCVSTEVGALQVDGAFTRLIVRYVEM